MTIFFFRGSSLHLNRAGIAGFVNASVIFFQLLVQNWCYRLIDIIHRSPVLLSAAVVHGWQHIFSNNNPNTKG